ncbi:putative protein PA1579 [Fibrisoma limi BUZ 3]|uniref:START domain-containing protein n=1 Tax=Fibrisoma limi BUZ 3 TaxID=1185876 RepID=I2GLU7_9BACT|nr:START domain-containing protein [Fibrisoma limi]CCH54873.1 putative protein PA1579 [Fibrisoma limi BUZ 3]
MVLFRQRFWLLACSFTIWCSSCLLAQGTESNRQSEGWKLEKDKNGIQVYARQLPDSRRKEVKVHCELTATVSQLVAYVSGIEHYREVMFRAVDAYVIRRVSEQELFYYHQTDLPWPASDRDVVMHMVLSQDKATGTVSIKADNVPGLVPEKKGVVRIPRWRSQWKIQQVDTNRLRVDYFFEVDPGGDIPVWLTNSLIATAPYQSFSEIEKHVKLPYYQNRTFSFLQP